MTDNFNLLQPYLDFSGPDTFYFLQIIRRRKDNPGLKRHLKFIKDFSITSNLRYESIQDEVKDLCVCHNARAYLRMNRRNFRDITFFTLKYSAELIQNNHFYDSIKSVFATAAGKTNAEKGLNKTFIVDLDGDEVQNLNTIKEFFDSYFNGEFGDKGGPSTSIANYKMFEVPTPNGLHLIVSAFNTKLFGENFPNISIHKDNPTVLFAS